METFNEQQTREYYNSFSDVYEAVWNQQVHTGLFRGGSKTLEQATEDMNSFLAKEAHIVPHSKILNIGSGRGGTDRFLAKSFVSEVVGLDLSERQIDIAKQRAAEAGLGSSISYIQGSMNAIPTTEQHFDYIWAQESFFHCHDKAAAVREFSRVLKPSGLVVMEDTLLIDPSARKEVLAHLERLKLNEILTPKEHKALFAMEGLVTEKSLDLSRDLLKTYQAIVKFIQENKEKLRIVLSPEYYDRLDKNFGFDQSARLAEENKLGCFAFFFRKTR